MADVVRELAAKLSLQVDKASFRAGDNAIEQTKGTLASLPEAAAAAKAAIVGAFGMGIKKAFLDFNNDIEQSVISLAAVQKMFKGTEWSASMETAGKLVEHYQEVAKASVGETRDFIEMHKGIAASAYQAGASLEDLKEITKGAVIASSSMGESAIVSAMDVKQALTKGVSVRDRFMVNLLASEKMTTEKFNAMTKKQRVETLKRLMTADWIKDASKQMEGSWAGVTSTMRDTINITLGKVGLPLFKTMTAEIAKWNKYLSNPNNALFSLAGRGASELASTFKLVAGTVGGIVGMLEQVNRQIGRLKDSSVGKIFDAFANPIREAYETIRDIADFLSGEASALGLSRAIAQGRGKDYVEHAQKGGKFDLSGNIVAMGQKGGVAGATESAKGAVKSTGLGRSAADFMGSVKSGNLGGAIESGAWSLLNMGALAPELIGKGATWAAGKAFGNRSPWQEMPLAPGGPAVSGEPLTSFMPGPWAFAPPTPALASMPSPEPVKLTGKMDVSVKVEATADTKVMSENHSTELRATGALYSSEP